MFHSLASVSCVFLLLATGLLAAKIDEAVLARMEMTKQDSIITVLLVLEDQADLKSLDQSLTARKASRAERHREVVRVLQGVAEHSQSALLDNLTLHSESGLVKTFKQYWLINAVSVSCRPELVYQLADFPGIETIQGELNPALVRHPCQPDNMQRDTGRNLTTTAALQTIGVDRVWHELGITGEGALLGSIDSGVNMNHESIAPMWRGLQAPVDQCWRDATGYLPMPSDWVGRGTAAVSLMIGVTPMDTIGVCPDARWIASNSDSPGVAINGPWQIDALEWLAEPDNNPETIDDVPDVVHNGWGFVGIYTFDVCDTRWWEAIDNLEMLGVCTVWPVGDEALNWGDILLPANRASSELNAFSTGSCNSTGSAVSPFSSHGRAPEACGDFSGKPEVVAPGEHLLTANAASDNSYIMMSGTSLASALVAGVFGLMRSADPDIEVSTMKRILIETCRDLGDEAEDELWGWGLIDAHEALVAVTQGLGQVQGTILAMEGGQPLSNVRVSHPASNRLTSTNQNGYYTLRLPAGNQTLLAEVDGFSAHEWNVDIGDHQVSPCNIQLERLPSRSVAGRLLKSDGDPIEGAPVTAPGIPLACDTTDAEGSFHLLLPVGQTIRIVSQTDFHPFSRCAGPDEHGYMAFDLADQSSTVVDLEVTEQTDQVVLLVNPPWGIETPLIDPEEGGPGLALDFSAGQPLVQTVPLPFEFMYYGIPYQEISICANGWMAMGHTNSTDPTNSAIPDPEDGPAALIAPFWDALAPFVPASGSISTLHDTQFNRFIIEFNRIRHHLPTTAFESFRLILLDPEFCPTLSGDGAFIMEYLEVVDPSSCTVGIESPDGSTGIQYHFGDSVSGQNDANMPLQNGLSVLYTTGLLAQSYLPAPTNLRITHLAGQQIRLDWSAIFGASGYSVEELRDGQWQTVAQVAENSHEMLPNAGVHLFRVRALAQH
jgi:hypothetical protein